MEKLSDIVQNLQKRLFSSIVTGNLVYNTCWEDPRIDRQLLQLNSDSKIVMLTSAGCNALDYLLNDVQEIHCIDANPSQNALLNLKKTLFKNKSFPLLWDFFGEGQKQGAEVIYQKKLRPFLPVRSQQFWDHNIQDFTSGPGFYFTGTSGKIALLIYNHIRRNNLSKPIEKLLNADSLEEQTYYFEEIEPQLWNSVLKWLIQRRATMAMLGVPETQQQLIEAEYQEGLLGYIRQSLRHVFTELPLSDNYFWRVYLTGSYSRDCCPNYLHENNFDTLAQRVDRIKTHTSALLAFLKQNPGSYSHFVLLDHQDWLANERHELLTEEWKQILKNAHTGSRILFRSAAPSLEFLPDFVPHEVDFQPEITAKAHQKDRVGTYESTHLGIVR